MGKWYGQQPGGQDMGMQGKRKTAALPDTIAALTKAIDV
jgi:hypothetical protein